MKHLRFVDEAREELLSQVSYYEERQKGLGERFRLAIKAATSLAATHPKLGFALEAEDWPSLPKGIPVLRWSIA